MSRPTFLAFRSPAYFDPAEQPRPVATPLRRLSGRVEYVERLGRARLRVLVDLDPDGGALFSDLEGDEPRWHYYTPSPEELAFAVALLRHELAAADNPGLVTAGPPRRRADLAHAVA